MPNKLSPQQKTLLNAFLRQRSLNTFEIQALDILAPAAIVKSLSSIADISSTRCRAISNVTGIRKTIALYTLEGFKDGK